MTEHAGGSTETLLAAEIAEEQAHVDKVYVRLSELTRTAQGVAADGRSLHQSDRLSFVREEDGTSLFERDAFSYQAAKRLATLESEHEGLVFGRLDRRDGEARYIGRMGVRDDQYEPLVVDWRARAAEPFYRATPANPMDVVRRRVLRCRGEVVIGVEDDLLDGENADDQLVVIGEGALLAALSRSRGPRMRDIVATIQGEQDEAIRAPYQGVTLITGGPGTGKTVVALHRAAYLLYSHRRRFENGGVLVVGPSSVFMNYIERVLPSLGEDSVTLRSIGRVADDVVPLGPERLDGATAATVKGGLRMVKVLRRLTRDRSVVAPSQDLRVVIRGEAIRIPAERLERIRTEVLQRHKINEGRDAALERVIGSLRSRWESVADEVAIEQPDAEPMTDELFTDLVTSSAAWRMFAQSWWPVLESAQVLTQLQNRDVVARVTDGLLSAHEQQALAASYQQPGWSVADAALLDELVAMIGIASAEDEEPEGSLFLEDGAGVQELVSTADRLTRVIEADPDAEPHQTYAHVLVDEAQDITPMQWRMLRRRGSRASWTIVGDPAQSSWPDVAEYDLALQDLIGNAPHRHFRMSTNYRSPAEVYDLAGAVIAKAFGSADVPQAVRSTGVEPELRVATDVVAGAVAAVSDLANQLDGSIGVVTAPSALAEVSAAVGDLDRIAVVTAQQSKGLEYDGVVVVDPDRIVAESPGGTRLLYVALTRPTQHLITIDPHDRAAWRPTPTANGA